MKKKFELIKKNYKEELYNIKYKWNKTELDIRVGMDYHTIRRYWTVYVRVIGPVFGVNIDESIVNVDTRKEAREIAVKWMSKIEKDPKRPREFN